MDATGCELEVPIHDRLLRSGQKLEDAKGVPTLAGPIRHVSKVACATSEPVIPPERRNGCL